MTLFVKRIFAPPTPPDGTHFIKQCLVSIKASNQLSGHAHRLGLSGLLEQTRPPDPEFADLIERAFLEGQIDGRDAELANALLWKTAPISAN